MKRPLAIVCLVVMCQLVFAQAKVRKLSTTINHPSMNIFAPFISLDGSAILFMSDYGNEMKLFYSQRQAGDWKQPVELPKQLNMPLNFPFGYSLSADGRTVYFTSIKSGGVGGYDMWACDLKGTSWSEMRNLFFPLNTKGNDACPTFTTDGNTVYFMRCEKMDKQKADKCKIFVSRKKPTGQWEEPTELPPSINTGNSQTPRIMADGETLIFSSNKFLPNAGGMDLYVTKFSNGSWSEPSALSFANTDKDDQFVSVQANGRYLLKEAPGKFKSEATELLIPDELRPKGVMKVEVSVKDAAGAPTAGYVSVTELTSNKRIYSGKPAADGSFFFYLIEGGAYELSVDHEQSTYTYFSKQYDLRQNSLLRDDKINIVLKQLAPEDEIELEAIHFKPYSSELEISAAELRRLTRLLKAFPQLNFEVQVMLAGFVEDSVQSSPDLTEIVSDSSTLVLESIDSLGQLTTRDSVVVKRTYHNDRTEKQARAIIERLVAAGIDRSSLLVFVNARPEEIIDNRKTTVKIVARKKK
jgi:hypothetical protein